MVRDELAGWLESFDRYNAGGRAYWLEAYGGRSYTVDRKQSPDPLRIPYNGVNVIGGIQPGRLAESLLDMTDDGMAARLLFIWPERRPWARPTATADLAGLEAAARRLDALTWEPSIAGKRESVRVLLSDSAADVFDRCQQFYRDRETEACGKLKSLVGKLPGLTLRLALASQFSCWAYEGGAEPSSISAETLEAVADFVAGYVLPMAERVYGDAALPVAERNAATLAKSIQRHRLRSLNARGVHKGHYGGRLPGMADAASVEAAIEHLVDAGWLKPDPHRKGGTVGRPTKDYAVNPAIWRAA